MKIIIVSGSYFPTKSPRAFRTTELARELSRQGHSVEVIIPESNLDTSTEKEKYGVSVSFIYNIDNRKLSEKLNLKGGLFNKIDRAAEILFEYPVIKRVKRVVEALEKTDNCDLLISIAYPHTNHWGCDKFIRKHPQFCKCWIADCGDPYMGATMNKVPHPFWFGKIEKSWCSKVDYITVPVEGAKEGYYKEFRDKIKVIPQGFRMDDIRLAEYIPNSVPTFAYSGAVGVGQRNPLKILDTLESRHLEYKAIIYTNQPDFYSRFNNNPRVELRKYVERNELLLELSKMDFLINLDNGTNRQLPSKLIDYAITGRPILNINVADLDVDKLLQFIKGDYSARMYVSPKEDYDIVNIAKKFIELARK